MVKIEIVTCPEWGARRSKHPILVVGRAHRIIFHHTAGHHPEITRPGNESRAEAIAYARAIQRFHMDSNGWIDSGHNLLICRNGDIIQGRWLTVAAIEAGHMVESAHCPGFNHQIGIEHEHVPGERMTSPQRVSSARAMAWIAAHYGQADPLPVDPHSAHFATSCPSNLKSEIPEIREMAGWILDKETNL